MLFILLCSLCCVKLAAPGQLAQEGERERFELETGEVVGGEVVGGERAISLLEAACALPPRGRVPGTQARTVYIRIPPAAADSLSESLLPYVNHCC